MQDSLRSSHTASVVATYQLYDLGERVMARHFEQKPSTVFSKLGECRMACHSAVNLRAL
jgi:hypothetical protein